jgi:ubiquitin-protein ligase
MGWSNPHTNRLAVDYQKLQNLDIRSPFVDILGSKGTPPDTYVLRLSCRGIISLTADERPVYGEDHQLGIHLPEEYPKTIPIFRFLTPIFHPNVHQTGQVCYGDEGDHGFAPSMGLDDLVVRIIQMIRYENIGLASPFNPTAANWAARHLYLFPIDRRQIVLDDVMDLVDDITLIEDDLDIKIL